MLGDGDGAPGEKEGPGGVEPRKNWSPTTVGPGRKTPEPPENADVNASKVANFT